MTARRYFLRAWLLRAALFLLLGGQIASVSGASGARLVEICTAHGVTQIVAETGSGPQRSDPPCLVCQVCCSGALAADAPQFRIARPIVRHAAPVSNSDRCSHPICLPRARAPPFAVV